MAPSASIQVLNILSNDASSRAIQTFLSALQGIAITSEASSQEETLRILADQKVDVVLLNLPAQNVDGIELTRQIRKLHPSVRVLISTANNKPEDIFAAMDAGADGYVLEGNDTGLEMAIRSVRLGTVWFDPGIAAQVLDTIVSASSNSSTRILQTGLLVLPLMPEDKSLLSNVAASSCKDGICMVDPSFVKKLRRYAPSEWSH
ncbi:MAG TPA: response regulator transcription factor [Candidatus Melainabacteria bacterium]|nr:response regulator transcription factor [Candidatus Melainabacteria bacterium]HIN66241.1 response regulator transcription factor [Candidatus Obscuribacterales bacterium]